MAERDKTYQSPSFSQLADPQEVLLQTPSDSLDGLLFPDVQPGDQTFARSAEELYAEGAYEKVLVDSFMTSPVGHSRSFDSSWPSFNIGDMLSDTNLTSDLNEPEIPQRTRESPGVNTSKTIWPENVTKEVNPMLHRLPPTDASTTQQGVVVTGGHAESGSPALSSLPLNLDFIRMPIIPLNPAFLAAKARQILQVDAPDFDSTSRPSSQSSLDLVGFGPSNLDADHSLNPSKIKQEDGIPYLLPSANPSGPGHPLLQKTPEPLFKNDPSVMFEAFKTSGGRPTSSPQFPSFVYPGPSLPSTSSASQARLQAFSLNGHQQHVMNYQPSGLQDLAHLYNPYASYTRSDTESEHSAQYNFEVVPQKMCLICGDEASGCHYGVLTCGSCKVFFKRAMEGQQNYLCAGRNDCIIDKIRRKNCPACRLRKCCQAGMVLGGRKFKKFSKMKTVQGMDTSSYTQPLVISVENQQAIVPRISTNSTHALQCIPQLLNILQSIEPEVVYAGYDNTQQETPSALLSSLNRLCERQLLSVVKWSKSLPGFRSLHIEDQITLLQYSWMSLMVFAMGWRSYQHVSGLMLYFAPDLILNEQRMKDSSIYSLCLSMWKIPQEFVKLQITQEEFLCMKALILLNTIPLEGLRSQSVFDEMRGNYIRELVKAIGLSHKGVVASSQRFYHLTKLMDSMHELVKKLHLFCLNTFLQSRSMSIEFPDMMSEVIAAQLPKILAGMVKTLTFHKK